MTDRWEVTISAYYHIRWIETWLKLSLSQGIYCTLCSCYGHCQWSFWHARKICLYPRSSNVQLCHLRRLILPFRWLLLFCFSVFCLSVCCVLQKMKLFRLSGFWGLGVASVSVHPWICSSRERSLLAFTFDEINYPRRRFNCNCLETFLVVVFTIIEFQW